MQVKEREEIETIHLYVVREDDQNASHLLISLIPPIILLFFLIAVGVLYPYHPPQIRQTTKVPAIFLPLHTFSTSEKVIPTGVENFPATKATGTITITNGSVIAQHLPAGMIFTGSDGVEVVTTQSVDVPAGDGTSYGVAFVSAQAVIAGAKGNIAPLDIQLVYGTSLYIKNYRFFEGGREAYSKVILTAQDTKDALSKARSTLILKTANSLLYRPCSEQVAGVTTIRLTWTCQFVRFDAPLLPGIKILHVSIFRSTIILDVSYIPHAKVFPGK